MFTVYQQQCGHVNKCKYSFVLGQDSRIATLIKRILVAVCVKRVRRSCSCIEYLNDKALIGGPEFCWTLSAANL